MKTLHDFDDDVLTVLSCDLNARPVGAPAFEDVLPAISAVWREMDALVVGFDPRLRRTIEGFAAAERACCSSIRWEVSAIEPVLRIVPEDESQMALLKELFKAAL
jgi:hypothetical protein